MKFLKYLFALLEIIIVVVFLYDYIQYGFLPGIFIAMVVITTINIFIHGVFGDFLNCGCEGVEELMWWNMWLGDGFNCDCDVLDGLGDCDCDIGDCDCDI